jgi:GGDEF domain-containing protein
MLATMATRFGQGDWSARAVQRRLPAEFVPLARAFNAMAARLGQREQELLATNDRLTVIASLDMLSGLSNRRGFQSRLDFEWLKAQQYGCELSLLMIDVDHFKLYNDTYGHPEGDACLTRLGGALSGIAAETMGFAGRYGGEEFCLLLPNTDAAAPARSARWYGAPCSISLCRTSPRSIIASPSASASPAPGRTSASIRAT